MSSIKRSNWWQMLRLCVLLTLTITASGCGLLSREPVVQVRYIDRECPKPPAINLPEAKPSGYYRELFLNALTPP